MNKLLLILLLTFSITSQAIDTDKFAHFGISYAATTLTYGFLTKTIGMQKGIVPVVLSSLIVSMITSLKELIDKPGDPNDILANSLGITSASITILAFDF